MSGNLITDLHIRFSREEVAALQAIGNARRAPASAVVRAMCRHFLVLWARGEDVTTELGAITWGKRD